MPDRELIIKIVAAIGIKLMALALIWAFFISNSRVTVSPLSVARHFEAKVE